MLKLMRRLKRSDRGAAAVEFALVAPLLLLIIFGLIDFGRMLNAKIVVSEAAREAARSAALEGTSSQPAAQARVDSATSSISGANNATISSYTPCAAKPAVGSNGSAVVSYQFEYITPVGAIASIFGGGSWGSFTMTAKGVMPCRA